MPVWNFNSPADFSRACSNVGSEHIYEDKSWTGETYRESMQKAIFGDSSLVPEAEKLIDKIYTQIDIPFPVWTPSVAGAYPVVPEFLMGQVECMRYKQEDFQDKNPVKIFVDISSSAGVSFEDLKKRGVAILAFTMVMQNIRPIELFVFASLDGKSADKCSIPVIKIDANTLSQATYCLTSAGFDRNLTHSYSRKHNGFSGHWAFFEYPESENYWLKMRKLLKLDDKDIMIKGSFLDDRLILDDPVKWCNQEIAKFKSQFESDAFNEDEKSYKPRKNTI